MAAQQQQQPDYWSMTNKELIIMCKKFSIHRWSGKRKKDLIAMIKAAIPPPSSLAPIQEEPHPHAPTPVPTPLPTRPHSPEPYEFLDETLLEHANRARAFLPKSPTNEDEPPQDQEWSAVQTTPATEGPIVRLPVGMAAMSAADIDMSLHIEF